MLKFMKLILQTLLLLMTWKFAYASEKYNLVYVGEQGCFYCEIWDEEIAHIYPKTSEGQFAPLIRLDITNYHNFMALIDPIIFTPTFVLIDSSKEISRIEGYIGDDLFWGMLEVMLKRETNYK